MNWFGIKGSQGYSCPTLARALAVVAVAGGAVASPVWVALASSDPAPVPSPALATPTQPSPQPTRTPAALPTTAPSSSPIPFPTAAPSLSPLPFPTDTPPSAPSRSPLPFPTGTPTSAPTVLPLPFPTGAPTGTPTRPSPTPTVTPQPQVRLQLRLRERRVYVYRGDRPEVSYPVAIGKPSTPTPTGSYRVFEMVRNPVWRNPWTGQVTAPGPNSALGLRWIGFIPMSNGTIGFHGTPTVRSIGQAASNGCVRMFNHDVLELFEKVSIGTPVQVVP